MFRSVKGIAIALGLSSAFAFGVVNAEPGKYGLGTAATTEEIAGWDIDVRPDGLGLPPGQGSVEEGEPLYEQNCAMCHGTFGQGEGRWPALAGGQGSLEENKPEKTIGSYWPYATTIWDYVHRAMPFFSPQSLEDNEVYAITAYLLYLNEIVEDDFVATQESLPKVEMPNQEGFFLDDRPDVVNVACMENCKNPDDIQITWDSTKLGVTPVSHFKAKPGPAVPAGRPDKVVAATDLKVGQAIYETACTVCHSAGIGGAPRMGDAGDWNNRLKQGVDVMVRHAIEGYNGSSGFMPPRGGQAHLTDDDVAAAVEFMINQRGG